MGLSGVALGSCGMVDGKREANLPAPAPRSGVSGAGTMAQDFPIKIGNPYQVGGVTYVPADTPNYDEVGYASWYGEESGQITANGEAFNANAIAAAHKTLPLPSYVEVTSLDTGRTILVRVNDRGPFANDRLIDLSRGAATQLGLVGNGSTAVRVRRVSPSEQERAALRAGGQAQERLETPASLLSVLRTKLNGKSSAAAAKTSPPRTLPKQPAAPKPAPATPSAPSDPFIVENSSPTAKITAPASRTRSGFVVPVAAFSTRERAETLARRIGAKVSAAGSLWRVRFGPYESAADAKQGVDRAAAAGFNGAKIVVND